MSQIFTPNKINAWENNTLSFYVHISFGFSADLLEQSFQQVVRDNDALRLRFYKTGALSYMQSVEEYQPVPVERFTVSGKENAEKKLEEQFGVLMNPLDFYPLRASIISYGDGGYLFIRVSHFMVDGYSVGLIAQQLFQKYTSLESGAEPKKAPAPRTFESQIRASAEYLHSEQKKEDAKFWFKQHWYRPGYRAVAPWMLGGESDVMNAYIEGELFDALKSISNNTMISFEFLLAYLTGRTISRHTGKKHFSMMFMSHGRRQFAQKKIVGCMFENVPMYFDFSDDESVSDSLKRHYQVYLESMKHSRFPVQSHTPMTYLMAIKNFFNWGHFSWMIFSSIADTDIGDTSRFDYCLMRISNMMYHFYMGVVEEKTHRIKIQLEYQKKLYSPAFIHQLEEEYTAVAREFAASTSEKDFAKV